MLSVYGMLFGQKRVSGKVTDSLERPIAGVKVFAKNKTGNIVQTDQSGSFTISTDLTDYKLIFSHVGYAVQEAAIPNEVSYVHIQLVPLTNEIEEVEVVSTGYQTIPKERSTGSFEHINTEVLQQRISANILDKLEGRMPGLQYDNRRGSADINIRGINTMSDGLRGPLIIVDNFPYEGRIEDINPNDVESVTLLKDAAASSIWGARAGNGVIVINLKKPIHERLQIDFSSNYTSVGKVRLKELPYMQTSDFIDVEQMLYEKGFYDADYNSPYAMFTVFSPVIELLYQHKEGTVSTEEMTNRINSFRSLDFRDDLLKYVYRNENLQQYALGISNGNDRSGYRMSASFNNSLGQKIGSSSENITLNFQHNLKLNEKIDFSTRMAFTNTTATWDGNVLDYNFSLGAGRTRAYPYVSLKDSEGNNAVVPYQYNSNFVNSAQQSGLLDWRFIPLDEVGQNPGKNNRQQLDAQLTFNYQPLQWLKLSGLYNYQTYKGEQQVLNKESSYYTRDLINQFTQVDGDEVTHIVPIGAINTLEHHKMSSHKLRGNIAVDKEMGEGKHSISAILGAELSSVMRNADGNKAFGYDPLLMTSQAVDLVNFYPTYAGISGNMRIPGWQSFSEDVQRYVSFYGNAAYLYDGKYTLSLSARRDASNNFGVATNEKWNPLWSTGFAWSIHKERFMQGQDWISSLRLRTTYGHSGNSGGVASSLPRISYVPPSSASLTPLPRAMVTDLPNTLLKWEDVRMINVGLDFSIFKNSLSVSVEYFDKKSTDLLSSDNIDPTLGFSSVRRNIGVLEGHGWDFSVTGRKTFGQFSFSSRLFLSMKKDIVREYKGNVSVASTYISNAGRNFQFVPDKQLYPVFALPFEGLDPENGNPLGRLNGEISTSYLQMTRDSLQNIVYFGTALPPYHGSFSQSFAWKNLNLSFLISYKLGHYFQRSTIRYNDLFNAWSGHRDFANRWQKPGDERHTTVPSMIYPANSSRDNFYAYSEVNIEKGDMIRLQDVNVSYNFTPMIGRKKVIFSAFAAVNNVALIWRANGAGLDPDYYNVPPSRRYSIGVNCKF
ncbi:SusC/RagA family TonB-linked outer membrane protein [Sphingobacterium wenxiniae]|uniref:TonB-linked outer membrane protein, SusC/RagA family n=1 Tax=Sphingobacterium wenxiniae TaxID=683125 RepID=A0A1I6UA40_9SPHI|nr:SusC/RagA family TonB-linked outer membrane protein [Sphingobacterium wenxiniae]SFS98264.1 TonB-linked outer membrane protein, SusC/RagA family [Sphingobacterium wenxiniae]